MKHQITLDEKDLQQAISDYLGKQGYDVLSTRIEVDKGDISDPRESGYRNVYAKVEVEKL